MKMKWDQMHTDILIQLDTIYQINVNEDFAELFRFQIALCEGENPRSTNYVHPIILW